MNYVKLDRETYDRLKLREGVFEECIGNGKVIYMRLFDGRVIYYSSDMDVVISDALKSTNKKNEILESDNRILKDEIRTLKNRNLVQRIINKGA